MVLGDAGVLLVLVAVLCLVWGVLWRVLGFERAEALRRRYGRGRR